MTSEEKAQVIAKIAKAAGAEIMRIYQDANFSNVVDYKSDNSPLTLADKASHNVIEAALEKYFPNIPLISEEGELPTYEVRKEWKEYWLIDPLDGTKEFIKRNGEFTVNIALIKDNKSILGVVYAPVNDEMYIGIVGKGAKKIVGNEIASIKVNKKENQKTAVRSKSHAVPEEEAVLKAHNVVDSISVGSSLKFCMVAEGKADIYYRHGPTMEWDTAAGQAVAEAAGGKVYVGVSEEHFTYNKESLLNGSFLCLG